MTILTITQEITPQIKEKISNILLNGDIKHRINTNEQFIMIENCDAHLAIALIERIGYEIERLPQA